MRTNGSHLPGSASSGKIASTGHSGSQAPQSMHSSGSMTRMRFASWMQSTGHTSTHDLSLMSMQGSEMMYVTRATLATGLPGGRQLRDKLPGALDERGFDDDLVESGGVRGLQSGRVGVVREADDRDVRICVCDLLGVDAGDVDDHEVGQVCVVDCDEVMLGQQGLELPPEKEIDPTQQDRRHAHKLTDAC